MSVKIPSNPSHSPQGGFRKRGIPKIKAPYTILFLVRTTTSGPLLLCPPAKYGRKLFQAKVMLFMPALQKPKAKPETQHSETLILHSYANSKPLNAQTINPPCRKPTLSNLSHAKPCAGGRAGARALETPRAKVS